MEYFNLILISTLQIIGLFSNAVKMTWSILDIVHIAIIYNYNLFLYITDSLSVVRSKGAVLVIAFSYLVRQLLVTWCVGDARSIRKLNVSVYWYATWKWCLQTRAQTIRGIYLCVWQVKIESGCFIFNSPFQVLVIVYFLLVLFINVSWLFERKNE